ncbi:MAG TPA: DUF3472 domain-containing protein [Tepidisphaeraceae bacterium]|jgi:hypothetical protein|nr:DUF3472 domain-containing protein [Tepidisphaeraceae bacterium]
MQGRRRIIFFVSLIFAPTIVRAQEIKVPGFTAYLDPNCQAAHIDRNGVTQWGTADQVLWGGTLTKGKVSATVTVVLPEGETATLRLTIGGRSTDRKISAAARDISADFGSFDIATPGYQRIELTGIAKSGKTFGDIKELTLAGPAAKDAFFNLKPRRNTASVHLRFPLEKGAEPVWFYNELVPRTDPVWTYYEACGFARGYFGIQVISPTERRIIFSVWDAGNEVVDRSKVHDENLVKLLAKGEGVEASDFGNEGTGGHGHLKYMWKTGQPQRCLVTAKADGDATIYTGYYYFAQISRWGLIASFRAPHDGKLLRDLYSFDEDFVGDNGNLERLCDFGSQWVKTADGKWTELKVAEFTHDGTGQKDRRDFGAGVTKDGRFYLRTGGFLADPIKFGDRFSRPATAGPPTDIVLP